MLAVKAGKDDLAKEALVRKQEYDGYAASFQKEYESQHASVEQLKDALRQLQSKIEEASRKKNLLIARAKRAEAQKQIQQTMGSLSALSFDTFDRMGKGPVGRKPGEKEPAAQKLKMSRRLEFKSSDKLRGPQGQNGPIEDKAR
jgi:phage shock protein A